MLSGIQNKVRGFTIIEVVIVLAIAGLIFAVVFIAVPQLQRGQRDTARENEIARFQAAATQWQSHNNGQLPAPGDFGDLVQNYLNDNFADPTGDNFSLGTLANVSYETGVVHYVTARICNASNAPTATGAGPRNYALVYELEQGGNQCVDNR